MIRLTEQVRRAGRLRLSLSLWCNSRPCKMSELDLGLDCGESSCDGSGGGRAGGGGAGLYECKMTGGGGGHRDTSASVIELRKICESAKKRNHEFVHTCAHCWRLRWRVTVNRPGGSAAAARGGVSSCSARERRVGESGFGTVAAWKRLSVLSFMSKLTLFFPSPSSSSSSFSSLQHFSGRLFETPLRL